jgi:hypothetical protein
MASSSSVVAALGQSAGPAASLNVDASKAANCFDPDKSLGSSMDDLSIEVIQKIYTPEMVRQWLAAGWGPITYQQPRSAGVSAGWRQLFLPEQRGRQRWWEDSSISDVLL